MGVTWKSRPSRQRTALVRSTEIPIEIAIQLLKSKLGSNGAGLLFVGEGFGIRCVG